MDFFIGDDSIFLQHFKAKVNKGFHLLQLQVDMTSIDEIHLYIAALLRCNIYNISPEVLFSASSSKWYIKPKISSERFFLICKSLGYIPITSTNEGEYWSSSSYELRSSVVDAMNALNRLFLN